MLMVTQCSHTLLQMLILGGGQGLLQGLCV